MNRTCTLRLGWATCLVTVSLVLSHGALLAAEPASKALDVVPDGALGFVVVNNPSEVSEKTAAMAKQLGQPLGDPLGMLKALGGISKGLDEKRSAALAVLPGTDTALVPVAFVPVSKFRPFVKQLGAENVEDEIVQVVVAGKDALAAAKGDYAVLVEADHKEVLKGVLASERSIAHSVEPLAGWMAQQQIAAVLTADDLKLALSNVSKGLDQAKTSFEQLGDQGKMVLQVFQMYDKLLKGARDEFTHVGVGVRIDEETGVLISKKALFAPEGKLAKLAKDIKPSQRHPLTGLPGGPFVVAGGGVMPEALSKAVIDFSMEMLSLNPLMLGAEKLTAEQTEQLTKAANASVKGVEHMSMVLGVPRQTGSIYDQTVSVIRVADAAAYIDNYAQSLEAFNELARGTALETMTRYEIKKVQIGDVTALEVTTTMPKQLTNADVPGMQQMMEQFFGPGGKLRAYVAAADPRTVITAFSKAKLRQMLAEAGELPSPLAEDALLAVTAKMLAGDAQWVGYVSIGGYVELARKILGAVVPIEGFQIPDYPEAPPVGIAAKVTPDALEGQMAIPIEVIRTATEFANEVRQNMVAPIRLQQIEQ